MRRVAAILAVFALCVAVAVIAVIQRPMARCRRAQDEAKNGLGAMMMVQIDFRQNGFYTSDLVSLDFEPPTDSPRYLYGFAGAGPTADRARALDPESTIPASYDPTRRHTVDARVVRDRWSNARVAADPHDLPSVAVVGTYQHVTIYRAAAIANLDDDPALDVWTIEATKKLVNVSDDCAD